MISSPGCAIRVRFRERLLTPFSARAKYYKSWGEGRTSAIQFFPLKEKFVVHLLDSDFQLTTRAFIIRLDIYRQLAWVMHMCAMAKFEVGGQFLQVLSTHIQKAAQYVYRPDFPLTFSASSEDEIWPFLGYGYSKRDRRCLIEHPFLRAVVREYKVVYNKLGRFHVCETGVCRGEEKHFKELFIEFECGLRFSPDWKPIVQLNRGLTMKDVKAVLERN